MEIGGDSGEQLERIERLGQVMSGLVCGGCSDLMG